MNNQPPQRFCTNCGQPLAPGAAFCVACGTPASTPSPGVPGAPPPYPPSYAQNPAQGQDDFLLAALAAGSMANRIGPDPVQRSRRRGAGLRGCGCLLLILVLLAGP